MESRQKVLELIRRFEDLPEGNESILRSLLVDLKFFIQENFGSDSQYLGYLRYVKSPSRGRIYHRQGTRTQLA